MGVFLKHLLKYSLLAHRNGIDILILFVRILHTGRHLCAAGRGDKHKSGQQAYNLSFYHLH